MTADRIISRTTALPLAHDVLPPTPDPDSTYEHLCATTDLLALAIEHLKAACRDNRVDESLGEFTLDALRGIRDAIEAELEAGNAQP